VRPVSRGVVAVLLPEMAGVGAVGCRLVRRLVLDVIRALYRVLHSVLLIMQFQGL
jgi:hypothetical protein